MILETTMLYLYVETPLHAGTGSGLSSIDLPIQRERTTQYPMIQGSSIKGKLRSAAHRAKTSQVARWEEDEIIAVLALKRTAPRTREHSLPEMRVFCSFPCARSMAYLPIPLPAMCSIASCVI